MAAAATKADDDTAPPFMNQTVALGAFEACADYSKRISSYFSIDPTIRGETHTDTTAEGFKLFAIGDVQPKGAFIHVFNEPALELIARELEHCHRLRALPHTSRTHHALGPSFAARRRA